MPSEPKTAIFTKAANLFFALLQTGVLSSMDRWGSLQYGTKGSWIVKQKISSSVSSRRHMVPQVCFRLVWCYVHLGALVYLPSSYFLFFSLLLICSLLSDLSIVLIGCRGSCAHIKSEKAAFPALCQHYSSVTFSSFISVLLVGFWSYQQSHFQF